MGRFLFEIANLMENKLLGYNVYYKTKKWEQKQQFCSDQKTAIQKCNELCGNYITEVWSRDKRYFLDTNTSQNGISK